jgi:hypothetical protein
MLGFSHADPPGRVRGGGAAGASGEDYASAG